MDTAADRPWTLEAVQQLTDLAREGVPVPVISLKLKRSIASIHTKLTELGLAARWLSGRECRARRGHAR